VLTFSDWHDGGFLSHYSNTINPFANPLSRFPFFDYPLWNLKLLLKKMTKKRKKWKKITKKKEEQKKQKKTKMKTWKKNQKQSSLNYVLFNSERTRRQPLSERIRRSFNYTISSLWNYTISSLSPPQEMRQKVVRGLQGYPRWDPLNAA